MASEQDIYQLEELLAQLKGLGSLTPYNLTLYFRERAITPVAADFSVCCSIEKERMSRDAARHFFEKELEGFFSKGVPSVCRFGGGFLGFVVPFSQGLGDFCLVGDGVRDHAVDLWQLAEFSHHYAGEAFSLLPHVESLPAATPEEVDESAREVLRRVEHFFSPPNDPPPRPPAMQVDSRLAAVARVTEQLERIGTIYETIALSCEVVGQHFQVTKLALALRETGASGYTVSGIVGLPEELGVIPSDAVAAFLTPYAIKKVVPISAQMRQALPALQGRVIACFPLRPQGDQLGFLAALDSDLQEADLLLISMVANAAGSRVSRILTEAEQSKASAISKRLMSLSNTLSQVDNKEQLYEAILGVAADLIDATQGSIMLIDSNGESMHIVFTLGMSLNVARCLPVKVGRGIAGEVAQSGEPLLINDIEKDDRFVMINRSRFKSKSLICIPLKLKNKTIGVLNLSDKKDLSPFCQADLHLLTSFANLASLMIERTLVLEQSVKFEQLSVTDSLTGLYNRRFLKNRLEEEISRSQRHDLHLALLFIDLDFFKRFNDVCGHLAGDLALKRTAEIIKATLRDMDVVARYGGEEFCAVLPGTSKTEALIVAERIRVEIESESFAQEMDIPLRRITASVGVAAFPEDGATYTELVHASDMALYQAKAEGRNRTVAAQPRVSSDSRPRAAEGESGAAPSGDSDLALFDIDLLDIEEFDISELPFDTAAVATAAAGTAAGTTAAGTTAAGTTAAGTAASETTASKITASAASATGSAASDNPLEPPPQVTPLPHPDLPPVTSQGSQPLAVARNFDALLEATVVPAPAGQGNRVTVLPFEPPAGRTGTTVIPLLSLAGGKEVPPDAVDDLQQEQRFFTKNRDFLGENYNES